MRSISSPLGNRSSRTLSINIWTYSSCACDTCSSLPWSVHEVPEGTEVEIQVCVLELELALELLHPLLELHERDAEALDLGLVERSAFDPPQRLAFHELPQKLDHRQHELSEALFDVLGIGVDPPREHAGQRVHLGKPRRAAHCASTACAKLNGGHGPVHASSTSGCAAAASSQRLRKLTAWSRS